MSPKRQAARESRRQQAREKSGWVDCLLLRDVLNWIALGSPIYFLGKLPDYVLV